MFFLNLSFSQISFCPILFPLIPMNMRFPTPPSTCRAFDFICVSLYFGLPIWMCMSFLNLHFFANLMFSLIIPWTRGFPPPPSTCCCLDFIGVFPLRWLIDLDLYVFFEPTIVSQIRQPFGLGRVGDGVLFQFNNLNLMICVHNNNNTRIPI